MDTKDPFKDLSFDGKPSGYREFRRKVILSVAALEYKSQHLAGPKLLTRLTGEAWRCTEHLNIAEVRTTKGWIKVIECLDRHYRYLPEVELHEAIDEFLFRLSRRQSEGATAFSSRFRTQLSRLETLIAQERVIAKEKRSKKKRDRSFFPGPPSPVPSSLGSSSESDGKPDEPPADETDESEVQPEPQASAAEQGMPAAELKAASKPPTPAPSHATVRSELGRQRSGSNKHSTAGSWKEDFEKQQLQMQQILGTVELSHTKPKLMFQQSVLGHLYMRKYGLSKEQRSQVIRAAGGSSRFLDVERIMRASDIEDNNRHDNRHGRPPQKVQRRHAYAVQDDDSSSIELPLSSSDGEDALLGEGKTESNDDDDESDDGLAEIYELQKKAKKEFKKSFKHTKRAKSVSKRSRRHVPAHPISQSLQCRLNRPQPQHRVRCPLRRASSMTRRTYCGKRVMANQ